MGVLGRSAAGISTPWPPALLHCDPCLVVDGVGTVVLALDVTPRDPHVAGQTCRALECAAGVSLLSWCLCLGGFCLA